MLISVASGKGGTGKTAVSLLLASVIDQVAIVDCDVEEPNCHLFLEPQWNKEEKATIMIPLIDQSKCIGCGRCTKVCMFNALAMAGKKVILFPELCHQCGGCKIVCPVGAITEKPYPIGEIFTGIAQRTVPNITIVKGLLQVGLPLATPLIKKLKKQLPKEKNIIVDCPPGTSCAMVASVQDTDYCVLVTEPTPFGQHDLELAANVLKMLGISAGVVINKSDNSLGDKEIETFCNSIQLPILGKIPNDKEFAKLYFSGVVSDKYKQIAQSIWENLQKLGVKI